MKKQLNTTILISLLLLLAVVASAFAVFYWDKKIWNFASYVREQRQVLKNERAAVQFLANVDKEIKQIQEHSEFFDSMYFSKESILPFIEKLESVARVSGTKLYIQSVTPGDVVAEKYNYYNVTLQSSGSWEAVTKFVSLVENMPHYISIKVLNLSSSDNEKGRVWTASMTITTLAN